jgi:hypothetical protein
MLNYVLNSLSLCAHIGMYICCMHHHAFDDSHLENLQVLGFHCAMSFFDDNAALLLFIVVLLSSHLHDCGNCPVLVAFHQGLLFIWLGAFLHFFYWTSAHNVFLVILSFGILANNSFFDYDSVDADGSAINYLWYSYQS